MRAGGRILVCQATKFEGPNRTLLEYSFWPAHPYLAMGAEVGVLMELLLAFSGRCIQPNTYVFLKLA
jgi:hypothetical protein